jgi:hypothetical protein
MSYYVKLSLGLHELPTSERLNHNKRQKKKKKGTFRFLFRKIPLLLILEMVCFIKATKISLQQRQTTKFVFTYQFI